MTEQVRDYADKIIREALLKRDNLRELIRAQVPDLADAFDFERMRLVSPKFLLPDGRDREADLLFEIPYRTGDVEKIALVCVLIEHQSRPDARMALRTLLYIVLYWEKQWSAWEELLPPKPEYRLPPVLPIVFHTGTRASGQHRSIRDLLGEPAAFHAFAPDWTPLFWELPKHSVEELLSSDDAFLQLLAVVRVEDAERSEFERVFRETWIRLDRLHDSNRVRWADLIYFIIGWITHRRPTAERKELMRLAEQLARDTEQRGEVKAIMETYADVLLAEGERKGEVSGKLKGELEGKLKEARRTILRLGPRRWGEPDSSVEAALNAIMDVDRLERMTDRLLDAASWQELLATA